MLTVNRAAGWGRKGFDEMGYAVEPGESARSAFLRMLEEELRIIRGELSGIALYSPDAVHDYRRHLKKARSLVRMARYAFPDRNLREIGRDLGAATRIFAAWREREALQESLDWLVKAGKNGPEAALWEGILSAVKDRLAEEPPGFAPEKAVEESGKLLEQVQASLRSADLEESPVAAFCRGAGRGYGQARKAMRETAARRDPHVLHEWRKQAKHLRHQVQILSTAWPACFGALESELHRLTDALGIVHDLALLREFLLATPPDGLQTDELAFAVEIIETAASRETEHAYRLGVLVFAEKPRSFRKRITKYLLSWESATGTQDTA